LDFFLNDVDDTDEDNEIEDEDSVEQMSPIDCCFCEEEHVEDESGRVV
jgi:hypothetical protein